MSLFGSRLRQTAVYSMYRKIKEELDVRSWSPADEAKYRFYAGLIRPGDLCFDIGANLGNRTKLFLKLGARVVSVEPQEGCMQFLTRHFGGHPDLVLVQQAMGEAPGTAEMLISREHTLSSLSRPWIEAVRESGRFGDCQWEGQQTVAITTLDELIRQHGVPAFIKIDVEGYEHEVIKGLSRPVRMLSLEFTPEFMGATLKCLRHLDGLGTVQVNYTQGESLSWALPKWIGTDRMVEHLASSSMGLDVFGDVYVRFV